MTTYLWNEALHHLPASIVSSFTNLVSVIGVASAYLLGENPPPIQIFGGALAILGVLLSSHQKKTGRIRKSGANFEIAEFGWTIIIFSI